MSDYSTNEGKFLESMRRFAEKVAESDPVDASGLEELMKFYAKPGRKTDPLLLLPPGQARALVKVQRKVSPDLEDHPFFRRVADIARERWGREMQELFCAYNYLVQQEICAGISPEHKPHPEVLQIILDARKAVQTGIVPTSSPSSAVTKASQSVSDLASILKTFAKENW